MCTCLTNYCNSHISLDLDSQVFIIIIEDCTFDHDTLSNIDKKKCFGYHLIIIINIIRLTGYELDYHIIIIINIKAYRI